MERRLELKAVARAIGSPKSTMRGGLCQTKGLHGRGGASQVGWPAPSHSQPMPMSRPPSVPSHNVRLSTRARLHRNYHLVRQLVYQHTTNSLLSTV